MFKSKLIKSIYDKTLVMYKFSDLSLNSKSNAYSEMATGEGDLSCRNKQTVL